ncbi:MAG: hypothetical protein ACR5KW_02210 [Wolbachia sp.]
MKWAINKMEGSKKKVEIEKQLIKIEISIENATKNSSKKLYPGNNQICSDAIVKFIEERNLTNQKKSFMRG